MTSGVLYAYLLQVTSSSPRSSRSSCPPVSSPLPLALNWHSFVSEKERKEGVFVTLPHACRPIQQTMPVNIHHQTMASPVWDQSQIYKTCSKSIDAHQVSTDKHEQACKDPARSSGDPGCDLRHAQYLVDFLSNDCIEAGILTGVNWQRFRCSINSPFEPGL